MDSKAPPGPLISSFSNGLTLQGLLPLRWWSLPAPPGATELAALEPANLELLRLVAALESPLAEASEEIGEGKGADLVARLDFKLNLLLDLVGQWLARDAQIPVPRPLTLTPEGLRWQEFDGPAMETWLRLELWLSGRYPRPLVLHGQVIDTASCRDDPWTTLCFAQAGKGQKEALERYIFVAHRREIAQRRRQPR